MPLKCPVCKEYYTVKDDGHFSSMKCRCGILIYYYDFCVTSEISRDDYINNYKKEEVSEHASSL